MTANDKTFRSYAYKSKSRSAVLSGSNFANLTLGSKHKRTQEEALFGNIGKIKGTKQKEATQRVAPAEKWN